MERPDPSNDLTVIAKIARRMCIIILGYAAAVASATLVTLLYAPAHLFSGVALFGMAITAIAASPAMLCFVAFSEIRYRVGPGGHILAGTLTALAAHGLWMLLHVRMAPEMSQFVGFSTLGGAIGGWTYWRVAVAHLQDAAAPWYDITKLSLPSR